jgi:hypothetical protein
MNVGWKRSRSQAYLHNWFVKPDAVFAITQLAIADTGFITFNSRNCAVETIITFIHHILPDEC